MNTKLRPLLRLRWIAVSLQVLLLIAGFLLPGEAVPTPWAFGLILMGAASNAVLHRQTRPVGPWVVFAVLLFDLVLLTGLLAMAQGSSNPFTALYAVYVAIAASVLPEAFVAAFVLVAVGSYGSLFWLNNPHAHHGAMSAHLIGMWLAFAVSAPFVAYTIVIMRRAILAARAHAHRVERLGSLATLAAGAAHELATPLATIQVAVAELKRGASELQLPDVELVGAQVQRCDNILKRLAVDAGHPSGPPPSAVTVRALLAQACAGMEPGLDVTMDLGSAEDVELMLPVDTVALALNGVVHNGLDASSEDQVVHIQASLASDVVLLRVTDKGPPIPDEVLARIGEPFFTTKGHEGMGLGVFFVRSVLEQVGGSYEIRSEPGTGTTVHIRLPR